MVRILERGHDTGVRAGRDAIARAWRPTAQKLMGPLVVVLLAKTIEGSLLGGERAAGRPTGTVFQRFVHPLVGAVLLGMRRQNALVLNAKARPMEDRAGRDGSRIALGQTEAGRYLRVIYVPDPTPGSVFVITAYELGEKALKALRRRQKSSQRKKP